MRTPSWRAVAAVVLALGPAAWGAELGPRWAVGRGQWAWAREIIPMVHQRSPKGISAAFCKKIGGSHGAWRATVVLAFGTQEAGIWVQGKPGRKLGFLGLLGGKKDGGGLALRAAAGKTLWQDPWAPWQPYRPYVIEVVVERAKARVQMFEWDAKTLVSQSPWVEVSAEATEASGLLGLYTREGNARFWGFERGGEALSPMVPDAPNKRRLVQGESPEWVVLGGGNWMWVTATKQRLRQYAIVERTKAISRRIKGARRRWQCRIRVDPGAGGAGMYFQTDATTDHGLLAWLGGRPGAGSPMLYEFPGGARWSGKQGHWRYNTEYVLRAETRKGKARVQLLKADGKTVIQDSSWVDVGAAAQREGFLGFHTWRGKATFWGFSKGTEVAAAVPPRPSAAQLGGTWQTCGDGAWQWADKARGRLRQTGNPRQAIALNGGIAGAKGTWRCRVKVARGTPAAGLVFQANRDRTLGFACVLVPNAVRLESLDGKAMWEDTAAWSPATEYVLEGKVMTDRVAVRVLAADARTVVAASPDIYVPDTNNARVGRLGLLVRGGQAEFWAWERR